MFKDSKAFSGFAVPDLGAAKAFYEGKLGLSIQDAVEGGLELHLAGGSTVLIYSKPDFVPATYTILNFPVTNIDAAVDQLIAAGIEMERYPGLEADEKGIARDPRGPMVAWFTDPAGNILSVLQMTRK